MPAISVLHGLPTRHIIGKREPLGGKGVVTMQCSTLQGSPKMQFVSVVSRCLVAGNLEARPQKQYRKLRVQK